jgi:IS5 family transposase
MTTPDFFAARIEQMIDKTQPLAVLASRLPWQEIEDALRPLLARKARAGTLVHSEDLLGTHTVTTGGGISAAGRRRLDVRLMASLLYLKHAFNSSDEGVVEQWSQNIYWQHFSGMTYFEPRPPCDATQIGRFRRALGEAGVEELLAKTIEAAVSMKAVSPKSFERIIVDSTVQEKAIAHPTDSRLLDIARAKLVQYAKREGIQLKQTFDREGKSLKRRAGGYAHAKQYKRMHKVLRRQRTILGRVMRDIENQLQKTGVTDCAKFEAIKAKAVRIQTQQRADKDKLYAFHAPEVECISKGKARNRYEFGVKVGIAITHKEALVVGARSFCGNPYDGHTLAEHIEQTTNLLQHIEGAPRPTMAVVDLGYRGVDEDNEELDIMHRGWIKSMTKQERKILKRRQAVEPVIGHLKDDTGMRRCHLKGSQGDALHAVLCAAGYNVRWLMRAIVRMGLKALAWLSLRPILACLPALATLLLAPLMPNHHKTQLATRRIWVS